MAARKLEFGIGIPQVFFDGRADPSFISDFLSRAETGGFGSAWVIERVFGKIPSLDPIVTLAYAAARTSKIRIGSSILLSVLRHPVFLAKSLASLDQLCQGRLIVGVGLGGFTQVPYYPAFGIVGGTASRRFEEGLRLLEALWTQEEASFQGSFWRIDRMSIYPKPYQKPRPPLWFGAHAPAALQRAARMGDGWMGSSVPGALPFEEEVDLIRRYLEEAGRDPATFPIGKRVYLAVDENRKRAAEKMRSWFGSLYRDPELVRDGVFGGAQECAERLRRIAAPGVDLLILDPIYNDLEQVQQLSESVLPHLR